MKKISLKQSLAVAVDAAHRAGAVMRKNLRAPKKINSSELHDIKLELDVRCQKLIERVLRSAAPQYAVLGEEGVLGDPLSTDRWVVDPIDGTVNFTHSIPHACVSIALQHQTRPAKPGGHPDAPFESVVGVVYDPFTDETFTAIRGEAARLNGKRIQVSERARLDEAIVSIGFGKSSESTERMLPQFGKLILKARKVRMMGAAALGMVYVASGRFDAYLEAGIRLWDVAAGGLILEAAGGEFWHKPIEGEHAYRIIANNGKLRHVLEKLARA